MYVLFVFIFSFPEILIFFVVGIPLKPDSVTEVDQDLQAKLEEEFQMYGDILQVMADVLISEETFAFFQLSSLRGRPLK
jgi:hypothetical protein